MILEEIMLSEIARPRSADIAWFQLPEVPRIVKYINRRQEVEQWLLVAGGMGKWGVTV